MIKKQSLFVIIFIALLIGCNQKAEKEQRNKFSGLWYLQTMEQQDSVTGDWNEWRNGMQGYILYDGIDNMAVHLTTKGYEKFDVEFPNFVDTIQQDALKHLTGSYVYFAKYTVEEEKGIVEHARISHSNPAEWNAIVKRKYTFSGDTLILQPVEAGKTDLRLKWIKKSLSE